MIELAMNTRSWLVRGAVFGLTWFALTGFYGTEQYARLVLPAGWTGLIGAVMMFAAWYAFLALLSVLGHAWRGDK